MILTIIRNFYKNRVKSWGKSYQAASRRRIILISVLGISSIYKRRIRGHNRFMLYRNLMIRLSWILCSLRSLRRPGYIAFHRLYLMVHCNNIFLGILLRLDSLCHAFNKYQFYYKRKSRRVYGRISNIITKEDFKYTGANYFKTLQHFWAFKSRHEHVKLSSPLVLKPVSQAPVLQIIPVLNAEEYYNKKKYSLEDFFWLTIRHTLTNLYVTLTDKRGHVIYSITPGQLGIKKRWSRFWPATFEQVLMKVLVFIRKYKITRKLKVRQYSMRSYKSYLYVLRKKLRYFRYDLMGYSYDMPSIHGNELRQRRLKRL